MKTFIEFKVICEKYSEEHAHRKLWNYFISHPEHGKEVRDALLDKNYDRALEIMNTEVQYSKTDPEHPLHFDKANKGFSAKHGKRASDEDDYNRELDDAIYGVHALASQKKLRGAVEKMHPARVTGGSDPNAKLSRTWKGAGGKNVTPKGDLEIYNPDNPKERRGISMKKGGGAQLASAEAGELLATYKAASKSFVQRFHGDKSKEERNRIRQDIMNRIERVANANTDMKGAGRDEKQSLKVAAQDILDGLHDEHPNLTRHVSQVSTTGAQKFGGSNAPGTAGMVLTGRTDKTAATAKSAEQQVSARPRQALPKGEARPGNVKVDYRPAPQQPQQGPDQTPQTPRQAKIAQLRQSIADRQAAAQHAQTAQELEQQKVQAEIELKMAIKAHGKDEEPRYSDGKVIPRQFRGTWGQNNPQLKQEFDQQRAEKTSALQAAQNAHASAVDAHQTHVSTPAPTSVDLNTIRQAAAQAQPTQQQPAPQQQPVSQQPDQNSEQRRKKEQDEMRKRMNAVAAENGAPNNA